MGTGFNPRPNNAVHIKGGAATNSLYPARLAGVSQPVVGDIIGKVGWSVEHCCLVGLRALMGTGDLVQQQDVHWPLGRAVQCRVPSWRWPILAEDVSLDISRKLDSR